MRTRSWLAAGFGVACCAAAATPLFALKADEKDDQKDKEKISRELSELESQRAKLDSRIRELRRQTGRGGIEYRYVTPEGIKGLTVPGVPAVPAIPGTPGAPGVPGVPGVGRAYVFPQNGNKAFSTEQWKAAEKAMAEAHKAMEEAMKNMPKGAYVLPRTEFTFPKNTFTFPKGEYVLPKGAVVSPDVRVWVNEDGKVLRSDDKNLTREQREKINKAMEKMREKVRVIRPETFNFQFENKIQPGRPGEPNVYVTPRTRVLEAPRTRVEERVIEPRVRLRSGGSDNDVRSDVDSLRREVERLREELRRERERRGDKESSNDHKARFLEPYGTV